MPSITRDRPPRSPRRMRTAAIIAATVAVVGSASAVSVSAAAATRPVDYAIDLSPAAIAAPDWQVTGEIDLVSRVALEPGGAMWQGIASTTEATTPQPGDIVHGSVEVLRHDDVDADATVLIRVTDDRGILAEHTDLTSVEAGVPTAVETAPVAGDARMHEGATTLWVELHNDTEGTIEFTDVRLWGERDGERVDYVLPDADFSDGFGGDLWGHSKAVVTRVAELAPGARAERAIEIDAANADLPMTGDRLTLSAEVFGASASPSRGSLSIRSESEDIARTTWDATAGWRDVEAATSVALASDVATVRVVIDNPTSAPVRLRALELTGERGRPSDDLNGDGRVDDDDRAWFAAAVRDGSADDAWDYDGDGEVTAADVDYFARFVLDDSSVVFPSLAHLDFLNEDVELDGQQMMITHLYSEPRRAGDPASGYVWVGDPQEGVSALDDVARAVIAYAEHHTTYGDTHSYRQLVKGVRFAMWMQADNGDFDNFVARDGAGELVKKDSQSSQTSFGYWAVRAWEAFATALPAIDERDPALAADVRERLDLIRDRVSGLLAAAPASGEGRLLAGDVWMSSIAVNAASREYAVADAGARASLSSIVAQLAGGIAAHQRGSFTSYPLGAIQNTAGGWDEWGSVQVEALARASVVTGDGTFLERARTSAESFLSDLLLSGRAYAVSPNKATYPQLNYGTASYVDNFLALYEVTGDRVYADAAGLAASWWRGNNPAETVMFNEDTGVAFDAVDHNGVNRNGGAESVVEALRGILRVQRVPAALSAMTASIGDRVSAQVVEAEDLARAVGGEDTRRELPDGDLNDPARALVTPAPSSGTDEGAVYADAQRVEEPQEIYPSWSGRKAIFVAGSGHNNVRLFDGGFLESRIEVGGEGQPVPGDSLAVRFSAIVQFDTDLDTEVLAVDAAGAETLLSDDSGFSYHPRTWYAGGAAVRTSPIVAVPEDAVAVVVRFSVTSTKSIPAEGYANVTEASLWRVGTPELRYGASDLSGGAYAELAADSTHDWTADLVRSDDYLVYASVRAGEGDTQRRAGAATGGSGSLRVGGVDVGVITAPGEAGQVTIVPVGRLALPAGPLPVRVIAGQEGLALDALIFYPVRTSVELRAPDGTERLIVRDADQRRLLSSTAAEVAPTDSPTASPAPTTTAATPGAPTPTATASSTGGSPAAAGEGDGALAGTGGAPTPLWWIAGVLSLLVGSALVQRARRMRRS